MPQAGIVCAVGAGDRSGEEGMRGWVGGADGCGENDVAMAGSRVDDIALRGFRRPGRGGVV